jgi:hypothetical protein
VCSRQQALALEGDLARIWGGHMAFEAKGWDEDLLQHYLRLIEPGAELAIDPNRIVTVLGRRDRVTPYDGGIELARKWQVPRENRFILDRGHFSVPVTLMRNHAPFRRISRLLTTGSSASADEAVSFTKTT